MRIKKEYRTFNGHKYAWLDTGSKSNMQKKAKRMRGYGEQMRVVPNTGGRGHRLYVRYKKSAGSKKPKSRKRSKKKTVIAFGIEI